jgi:hypothetical protein
MDPLVDLATGAEDDPLALEIAGRIRQNLVEKPEKLADFLALRGTVFVVMQDVGESITLRFDHGRLTIHEGQVGVPTVTFCGDLADLWRLPELPLTRWGRLPIGLPFAARGGSREAYKQVSQAFSSGRLQVYGLYAHPRMVVRLLRIISRS